MRITRLGPLLVGGLAVGALVVFAIAASVSPAGELAAPEYAETVCGPLGEAKSADDAIAARFVSGPGNIGPSQQDALDLVTGYQQVWVEAAAELEGVFPRVPDGEGIGQLFVDHATRAADEIQEAIDDFTAVDPASPTYAAALNTFGYAGAVSIRPGLGDPLDAVTDPSVRAAFEREPTCAGLFASLAGGPITELPVPSPVPFDITAGPDGALWFSEFTDSRIGTIDPGTGEVTEFPLPAAVNALTAGPDGTVWFTERDPGQAGPGTATTANKIGKIDPATGTVTEFPVLTPNARPSGITTGPDGNVWFTERTGNQIGQIDPATGAMALFPIPTANAQPGSITAGPDGNLWFTETANRIGRVDAATGAITEFPVPTAGANPFAITAGPDGNLWFTETGGNLIGRIDPATGAVSEFPVPNPAAGLFGITAGRDGNLWFTENNTNTIGRIEPATGAVTEYPVPTANSQPAWITAGPDGNLWFTEEIANQIGKIDLDAVDG